MFVLILFYCAMSIVNCENVNSSFTGKVRIQRNANDDCGVASGTSGLISGGKEITRGDYPWMVAVWLREEKKQPKYICGGILISARIVVTAAHCLQDKTKKSSQKPKDLLLMLGAFDLNDFFEPRLQVVPSKVIIHDHWNPFVERFNDDIALITLEEEVKFTRFIRPICLLPQNEGDHPVLEGIVVGWGKSENTTKIHENIPRMLEIPIAKSNEECYRLDSNLAKLGSENSFCAGKPGVGACLGDSGSGFIFKIENRFHLKGIVSSSLINRDTGCYTENYAIYTDVPKYIKWIENLKPKSIETCGMMSASTSLVVGGELSTREQFPWIVQIFKETDFKFIMRGAGSLISDQHVLTSARSVSFFDKNTNFMIPVGIKRLKLVFGSTKSASTGESESIVKIGNGDIKSINLHLSAEFGRPSTSDVAVITLKTSIIFSRYISSVCLWEFNSKIDGIVGRTAYGVGFGYNQNDEFTGVKKHVPMIIDNQERCKEIWGDELIIGNQSEYFCASGRTGNVANYYDSPLYIKYNDIWFLRGLMSMRWILNKKINAEKPLLYENTAIYVNWIKDQM